MAQALANGIRLEYERYGSHTAETILLVMGLGAQLTRWPMPLVDALVARGFCVIRYDNRDIGLSSKLDSAGVPDWRAVATARAAGTPPPVPYTLSDMAADAVGLLDALGIARAHIAGASMGGMIAQLIAAEHPERVLTLTSIMSSSGNPALPPPTPEALEVLTTRPADPSNVDAIVAHGVRAARVVGSPAYPTSETDLAARTRADFERSHSPAGFARQYAAVIADGDRRARLARITAPALVIHGDSDPLVPVEAGRDTAASIAGAKLHVIAGMGHDLPLALVDEIAEVIAAHAASARTAA